jgi:hypothetical protein
VKLTITAEDVAAIPGVFDWALRSLRAPGDEIIVAEGVTVTTRGNWAFGDHGNIQLASGVSLIIQPAACVRLAEDAERVDSTNKVERESRDLNLLWIGDGCTIRGGRFDANGQAHPGWSCGGIRAHGGYRIEDTEIVGLSGDRARQESFAISSIGATGGSSVRRVRVKDCLTADASTYVAGIYLGATADNGIESVVEDCRVDLGEHGQFAYSSSYATRFNRCHGDAMRVWYTDTGPGIATLENCTGMGFWSVVGSVATDDQRREVTVRGGAFVSPKGRAVEWWDRGGHNEGFVTFNDASVDTDFGVASDAQSGSLVFVGKHYRFRKNYVTPGSPRPVMIQ